MTAPELQRVVTREVIERQAEARHRELARAVVAAGGRVAIVHRVHHREAEIWPLRGAAVQLSEPLAISWVEYALNRGWLTRSGMQRQDGDGAVWVAYVLTPAGRRFAAEIGRDELLPPLPGFP